MKLTQSISLNGTAFQMEEEAYQLLQEYLQEIEHAYPMEDEKDIITDIEARIAELCSNMLVMHHKNVVDKNSIEQIIAVMGHPETNDSSATEKSDKNSRSKKMKRKLFRDPTDIWVSGVMAGIAAYTKLDVTLLRLMMIVLTLVFGGWPIFIYLLFWVLMPKAKSTEDYVAMHGGDLHIVNIAKNVNLSNQSSIAGRIIGGLLKTLLIFLIALILLPIVVLFCMVFCLLFGLIALPTGLLSSSLIGGISGFFLLVGILLVLLCPIIMFALLIARMIRQHSSQRARVAAWGAFIGFLVGVLLVIVLAFAHRNALRSCAYEIIQWEDFQELREDLKDLEELSELGELAELQELAAYHTHHHAENNVLPDSTHTSADSRSAASDTILTTDPQLAH